MEHRSQIKLKRKKKKMLHDQDRANQSMFDMLSLAINRS